jgi:hypothetical protein
LAFVGEPQVEEVRERNGNSWTTGSVTSNDYAIEVSSVSVPGYSVLPQADDCDGSQLAFDLRTTNPSAQVLSSATFGSDICRLEGLADGAVLLAEQDVRAPRFEVVIDDGVDPLEASGIVELHGWSGSTTAPLVSRMRGEQVADLTIGVTLNRIGDRIHESVRDGDVTERVSVVSYLAAITVDTSDERSGTADCFAEEITGKTIIRPDGSQ